MQRIDFAIKKQSNNQKVVSKTIQELENKRESHAANIALTKKVLRVQNTDTHYIQSESADNIYYLVHYEFNEQNDYCSCPDSSIRRLRCKHQIAIEYAIRLGTLKDIDKFNGKTFQNKIPVVKQQSKWSDSQYDF